MHHTVLFQQLQKILIVNYRVEKYAHVTSIRSSTNVVYNVCSARRTISFVLEAFLEVKRPAAAANWRRYHGNASIRPRLAVIRLGGPTDRRADYADIHVACRVNRLRNPVQSLAGAEPCDRSHSNIETDRDWPVGSLSPRDNAIIVPRNARSAVRLKTYQTTQRHHFLVFMYRNRKKRKEKW